MRYKLFGLQRTSTNLIRMMMRRHFNDEGSEIGYEWKHGFIDKSLTEDIKLLICFKDIHAWCRSCWQYFHANDTTNCHKFNKEWSISEFIRSPHYTWETPIHRWNELNRHYLDCLKSKPKLGCVIRSEDLYSDEGQLTQMRLLLDFGFEQKAPFTPIRKRVSNMCRCHRNDMDWVFYNDKKFITDYNEADLLLISGIVDQNIRRELNYEVSLCDK